MNEYRGWHTTYSEARPVTGRWRAERFGVGLSAGSRDALLRMIDQKVEEQRADFQKRLKEIQE